MYFIHIDDGIGLIDILQILLELEGEMPRHEHVLLLEFFLAHALVAVLKRPNINQSFASYFCDPDHLFYRLQSDFIVGKMMNDGY